MIVDKRRMGRRGQVTPTHLAPPDMAAWGRFCAPQSVPWRWQSPRTSSAGCLLLRARRSRTPGRETGSPNMVNSRACTPQPAPIYPPAGVGPAPCHVGGWARLRTRTGPLDRGYWGRESRFMPCMAESCDSASTNARSTHPHTLCTRPSSRMTELFNCLLAQCTPKSPPGF